MTTAAEKVLHDALELSPMEKAELINRLFMSFSTDSSSSHDEAWRNEVESRIEAYKSGKLQADTVDAVFDRIASR